MRFIGLAIATSVFLAAPAFAEEQPMKSAEVTAFLNGATVEGNQDGAAWSQTFDADGTTLYTTTSGETSGQWQLRGDKFCSLWPPATGWDCYDITGEGENISFVPEDGSKAWPATRKAK